ncbi:MAG: O-Antigen ligase [Bacteroidetes bacterium ADurb.Bin408]|nr:MAG: O-Antigen ligase [Bacteroidetes bacterium ADurb.Bin408]
MSGKYYTKFRHYLLYGIALLIPVSRKGVLLLLLLYGLNWLILQNYKEKFNLLKQRLGKILIFSSLYIIYALSLLWSSNLRAGLFDLQVKLSLFLIPFILFSEKVTDKSVRENVFKSYIAGCIITVCYCFINSLIQYTQTHAIESFVYIRFSVLFHPTYFSLFLNFAIVLIFFMYFSSYKHKRSETIIYGLLILIFSASIVLANSKAVLITLFITYLSAALYYGYRKNRIKESVIISVLLVSGMAVLLYHTPQINNRLKDSKRIINEYLHNEKLRDNEGTAQRILVWRSSIKIIKEYLYTGVGAGDVKDMLMEDYMANHYKNIVEKKLNSHNQYLQTMVALGIPGVLFLLMILFYPLILNRRNTNYLQLMFVIITAINFLTESMLETQAGVVFFAFFNTYLFTEYFIILPARKNP